eukprot:GFUD01039037.1.p1 GENE.GFUD01039037.1~~GFUD01039037.1.p1  ORF type:complete len:274 (+),score=63.64 GFUD01039037.1:44-865(+)
MEPGSFNLSSNDFSSSVTKSFKKLLNDNNFSDVTLVCDDGRQMEAHKVILGSSSQFFQKILLRNLHQHPLIYLTEVKYEQLKSLMNFIYIGETEVGNDDLENFMKIAKKLGIQGLVEHTLEISETDLDEASTATDTIQQKQLTDQAKVKQEIEIETEATPEMPEQAYLSVHAKSLHAEPKLNAQIDIQFPEDALEEEIQEKENNSSNNSNMIVTNEKIKCTQCDKTFSQSGTRNRHMKVIHSGVRYQCDQCEYDATYPYTLKKHISILHSETA